MTTYLILILRDSCEENESTVLILSLILLSNPWLRSTILHNIKKKKSKEPESFLVKVYDKKQMPMLFKQKEI